MKRKFHLDAGMNAHKHSHQLIWHAMNQNNELTSPFLYLYLFRTHSPFILNYTGRLHFFSCLKAKVLQKTFHLPQSPLPICSCMIIRLQSPICLLQYPIKRIAVCLLNLIITSMWVGEMHMGFCWLLDISFREACVPGMAVSHQMICWLEAIKKNCEPVCPILFMKAFQQVIYDLHMPATADQNTSILVCQWYFYHVP